MNQPFLVNTDRCRELLRQAADAHSPVTLDYRLDDRWTSHKSRLIGIDATQELVLVDAFAGGARWAERLDAGMNVGVSFRHGHRKCVFTSAIVDHAEQAVAGGPERRLLRLMWPEQMHELQRRLYHRTVVPDGRMIPVDIWPPTAAGKTPASTMPQRGRILDLSGGGLSLELPRGARLACREDDVLTCRFAAGTSPAALEIETRICHADRLADGRTRLGLQFVGLDTSDDGRRALQHIQRFTAGLRYGAGR